MSHSFIADESIGPLLRTIEERIPLYFPELLGKIDLCVTRTRNRSYSRTYWVKVNASAFPARGLVIKVCGDAALQHEILKTKWHNFAEQQEWKIPQPVDYLRDHSALVMEEVQGSTIARRLPRISWYASRCEIAAADCYRAGQWLRFYHDIGRSSEPLLFGNGRARSKLDETLRDLSAAGLKKSVCYRLLETYFVPSIEAVFQKPRTVSSVHGDFSVDNVIINDRNVVVLDLCSNERNAIDLDIASFLNSLLLLRLTRPVPWSAIRRMRDAFLQGYFGSQDIDCLAFTFLQGIGLADVALEIIQRRRSNLLQAWVEWTVGEALKTIVSEVRMLL